MTLRELLVSMHDGGMTYSEAWERMASDGLIDWETSIEDLLSGEFGERVIRYALVTLTWERDNPEPYLPGNYRLRSIRQHPTMGEWRQALIEGTDNAGWTLDGYVLPRLASGGMYGIEVTAEVLAQL